MTDVRVDNPADFPPQEDTVERLWTPQRMTYVPVSYTHLTLPTTPYV